MKRIKTLKKWGIYKLNQKEIKEYGFNYAVIHPNNMGSSLLAPNDTDIEMESTEAAESWINNY